MANPEDFGGVPITDPTRFGGVPVEEPNTQKANRGLAQTIAGALAATGKAAFVSLVAPTEAALNVVTGLGVGAPIGLVGGAGAVLKYYTGGLQDEENDPKVIMKKWAEVVTYKPRTKAGQAISDMALYPLDKLAEFSEFSGHKVAKETGSAGAGAITEASLQILPLVFLGSLGRRLSGKTPKPQDFIETADVLTGEYLPAERAGTSVTAFTPVKEPIVGASTDVSAKLQRIYEEIGLDPQSVLEAARSDPTIIQDLVSTNRPIPESFITAYHGSPYDFTRFDSSKIGTGEGAQSYGHGLYIAETTSTAKTYATPESSYRRLSGHMAPMEEFAFDLLSQGRTSDQVWNAMVAKYGRDAADTAVFQDSYDSAIAANKGNIYTVRVPRTAVDAMLDWDKPLSEQPKNVIDAVAALNGVTPDAYRQMITLDPDKFNKTGKEVYQLVANGRGQRNAGGFGIDQEAASKRLSDLGIPGIKYLDQGSRTAGEGTRNFVVFDENNIDITHKNGDPLSQAERVSTIEKMQPPEPPKDGGSSGSATPSSGVAGRAETPAGAAGGGKQPPPPSSDGPPAYDPDYIRSRIVAEPSKKRRTIRQFLDDTYTRIFDRIYPIPSAKQAAKMGVTFEEGIGPREALRLTAGSAGKAKQFIENGTFDALTYKDTGQSLRAVLKLAGDDVTGFESYIVAKHSIEREAAGKSTGFDLVKAQQEVDMGRVKFEEASQALTVYKDSLIDYSVKAGIIPAESVAIWKESYKSHVPFYRLFEDESSGGGVGKTPHNPVKRAKGSEREILPPITSIINDTYNFIALAEQNMARQKMLALPEDIIKRVPDRLVPITLQGPEIRAMFDEFLTISKKTSKTSTEKTTTTAADGAAEATNAIAKKTTERVLDALTARGFTENEAAIMVKRVAMAGKDGGSIVETLIKEIEKTEYIPEMDIRVDAKVATVFRTLKAPAGPNEIVIMVEGKRQVYAVERRVAEAYNGLDAGSSDILTAVASIMRAGIITTPEFVGRNLIRDLTGAFVFAGAHPINTFQGAVAILKKNKRYQNWLKGGGANAAMVSVDRHYLKEHLGLAHLDGQTHFMSSAWNVIKSPFEAMRIVGEFAENMTRVGATKDIANAKTKVQIQALSLIARESTVDFSRHGSAPFLRDLTRRAAFANPALVGIDRFARSHIDNPMGTTLKAVAAITIPSVLLWYVNHNDEWTDPKTGLTINRWKELPRWERDLFWIILTDNHIIRIPKSFELGVIYGSLTERLLDHYVEENPDAFKHFGKSLFDVFSFNLLPTASIPFLQQVTNYNFFTERPLINASDEKILPQYQYTPYTLESTKALGRLIANTAGKETSFASPKVIDNYIRGWTGTLGTYAMKLSDLGLRKAGVLPDPVKPTTPLEGLPVIRAFMIRNPSMNAQSIQDFYDNYQSAARDINTIEALKKRLDIDSVTRESELYASKSERLDGIYKGLTNIRRIIFLIDQNPNSTPDEKRQLIDSAFMQAIQMANAGNDMVRNIKNEREKNKPKIGTDPASFGAVRLEEPTRETVH